MVNDCFEPPLQTKANPEASVSLEKRVVSAIIDPPDVEVVEQASESPSKSTLTLSKARESRDWKPSAQYFKPLNSGKWLWLFKTISYHKGRKNFEVIHL